MRRRYGQAREVPLALDETEPTSQPFGCVLGMSSEKFLGPAEALRVGLSFALRLVSFG